MLFDLDRFKVVNDSLGHGLGDILLVTLAKRIDEACPPGAILARMGGDELVVLVEGLAGSAEAVAIARELGKALNRPVLVEGHEVATTASVGIAFTAEAGETADDLLRHADAAMYAAKELGRDRIEVFDETLRSKVRRRLQDEIELRQAVENDELVVHYQPEIEIPSGRIIGAEALVRWQHPTRGLLSGGRVHRPGRGDGPHPRHRSVGAARGLPPAGGLAGRAPRSSAPGAGEPVGPPDRPARPARPR